MALAASALLEKRPVANIGGKFSRVALIASGAFGEVFIGRDARTGQHVAIKVELAGKPDKYLRREVDMYVQLEHLPRVPELLWYGRVGGSQAIVTELLGPSLGDLFELCSQRFSLKTVLLLAEQLLLCIESVHSRGIVHRDIKPENFLIGLGPSKDTVYVVDFGLASFFKDPKTKQHITWREGRGRRGTRRYMSIQAGLGNELSRRDDLESIAYVLLYFLNGRLPWQSVKGHNKDALYREVTEMKKNAAPAELCEGLPTEFIRLLEYCRALGFQDRPDYDYLRSLMRRALLRAGFSGDAPFDWTGVVAGTAQNAAKNHRRRRGTGTLHGKDEADSETQSPTSLQLGGRYSSEL